MAEQFHILLRDENFTRHRAGETIFSPGDRADRMFAIRAGEVEIVHGDRVLTTLGVGEVFGEMGLIEHGSRSALARARTDCEVVPIDDRRFLFLVQQTPHFALKLLRTLADRLRRTTENLD